MRDTSQIISQYIIKKIINWLNLIVDKLWKHISAILTISKYLFSALCLIKKSSRLLTMKMVALLRMKLLKIWQPRGFYQTYKFFSHLCLTKTDNKIVHFPLKWISFSISFTIVCSKKHSNKSVMNYLNLLSNTFRSWVTNMNLSRNRE